VNLLKFYIRFDNLCYSIPKEIINFIIRYQF